MIGKTNAVSGGGTKYESVHISLAANNNENNKLYGVVVTISHLGNAESQEWIGETLSFKVEAGASYTISASAADGFYTPKPMSYIAQLGNVRIVTMTFERHCITTIRINQAITDPASMITLVEDTGGIQAIRANSHRYMGKKTSNGVMTIYQLDDNNSTKTANGKTATLASSTYDIFMRLPRFFYRGIKVSDDVMDVTFYIGDKILENDKEWDGNDLIGVYEAYVSSKTTYSRSGVTSTGSVSRDTFRQNANARGPGYSLVKWKHHCIMAWLFMAYYRTTDAQAICGSGTAEDTGATNNLGMNDSTASSTRVNFWGLEDWWGGKYEWVDNCEVISSSSWNVTEDDGSVRVVTAGASTGFIRKINLNEFLDVAPSLAGGTSTTGFCDHYQQAVAGKVVARSNSGNSSYSGLFRIACNDASTHEESSYGSRLAFRGTLIEATL